MHPRLLPLWLLILAPILATAAEPICGEDKELFGDFSAAEYFKKRAEDLPCREELAKALEAYKKTPTKALREALLAKIDLCGDCDVRPQADPEVKEFTTHTEVWYSSDGSCHLPLNTENFKRLTSSLLDLKQYPKKTGGFTHMLEFIGYDSLTKKQLTKIERSPFEAYLAVSGPVLGGIPTAATYYIENKYGTEGDYFYVDFHQTSPPLGYKPPPLFTPKIKIPRVEGTWCVSKNGHIRYSTKADFGLQIAYAADIARSVLLDTLVQFSERVAR